MDYEVMHEVGGWALSRTRRSFEAFTMGLGATGLSLVAGLVVPPLLLEWMGEERVGVARVAGELIGYLVLLDIGFTGKLQAAFSEALGRGGDVSAVAVAGFRAYVGLAAASSAACLALAAVAPYLVTGLSDALRSELRLAMILSACGSVLIPLTVFRCLAEAAQHGSQIQIGTMLQTFAAAALSVAFAYAGAGLVGQAVATQMAAGVGAAYLTIFIARRYPDVRAGVRRPPQDLPRVRDWNIFAFGICGRVSLLSDAIILGAILGPAAVVRFVFTQRLLTVAQLPAVLLGNVTWAALANLHYAGQAVRFESRVLQLTRWVSSFALAALIPTAVLNPDLVAGWVGASRYAGPLLTWSTAVYLWLHAVYSFWAWQFSGTGRVGKLLPLMAVGAVVNVGVSCAGCFWFGEAGPSLGSLANFLGVSVWWTPLVLRREFGFPVRSLFAALFRPLLGALPAGTLLFLAAVTWPIDAFIDGRWPRFAAAVAISAAGFCILFGCILLVGPKADRRDFLSVLGSRGRS